MLRVNRTERRLGAVSRIRLPDAGLTERGDIQQMIRNSSAEFFAELGEELLLVGEEIRPTATIDDRIDLLAIDRDGAAVVIELKRGSSKLHLLQALSYAAMVSEWEPMRVVKELQAFSGSSEDECRELVERFVLADPDELNSSQRVILIAEEYDYALLVTAEWLSEVYGVDIRCYRMALAVDGDSEYLACSCAFPQPELVDHAKARGRKASIRSDADFESWDALLAEVENQDVARFVRSELAKGVESNFGRHRYLSYRIEGKRRFQIRVHRKNGYAWQQGRFDGDIEYWRSRLSTPSNPEPVKHGAALRFYLRHADDFAAFLEVLASGDLTDDQFV